MKKVNTLIIFFSLFSLFSIIVNAQDTFSMPKSLISPKTFNDMILEDFSYLITGDNSPQQGASFTLAADGSSLKLDATLHNSNLGIFNVIGDFSTTNGVYFFDDEKGGKKAKVGINYYQKIWATGFYTNPRANDQLALVKLILKLLNETHTKIEYFKSKDGFKDDISIANSINSMIKSLNKIKNNYKIDSLRIVPIIDFDSKYKLTKKESLRIVDFKENKKDEKDKIITKKVIKDFNLDYNAVAINKDFKELKRFVIEKMGDSIASIEKEFAKDYWNSKHVLFLNGNVNYTRESFKSFKEDSTIDFDKMFTDEKGDLIVLNIGVNYNYQKKKGGCWLLPNDFLFRASFSVGEGSNFSSFETQSIIVTNPLGEDIDGNPIVSTSTKSAYTGSNPYDSGTSTALDIDFYSFPFKNFDIGFFGEFRHEYIRFNTNLINDIQLSPLRLGLLYTIKNKEKKKEYLITKVFMDRTDLSLSPNGNDNDLRFGIAIGIPFNLR